MFGLRMVLLGYLVPAALAAAGAVLARVGPRAEALGGRLLLPIVVGVATLGGLIGIAGWPGLPAPEAWRWTIPFAALATMAGAVEAVGPAVGPWRWGLRLLLVQGLVGLILRPLAPDTFSIDGAAARWLGLVPAILFLWGNLETLSTRLDRRAWTAGMVVAVSAISVALILSKSLVLGQVGLVLVATLAPVAALTWMNPSGIAGRGLTAVPVVVGTGLLLAGFFYAELSLATLILLAVAPLGLWAGTLVRRGGWRQVLVCVVAVLIPAAIAVGLCFQSTPPDDNPYD